MKPSDFFVRGRQLFGFLLPGAMWTSALFFFAGQSPIEWVEGGEPVVRASVLLALSYAIGFSVHSALFHIIGNWRPKSLAKHEPSGILLEAVKSKSRDMFSQLLVDQKSTSAAPDSLQEQEMARLCRWWLCRESGEVSRLLAEAEMDINFLLALPPAAIVLTCAWLGHTTPANEALGIVLVAVVLIVSCVTVYRGLQFRAIERRTWMELFLLYSNERRQLQEPANLQAPAPDC